MNFSCGKCGRTYSVADERVRGKSFKVKCRGCDFLIVVKPAPVAYSQPDQLFSPSTLARVKTDFSEDVQSPEPNQRAVAVEMVEEEIHQRTGDEAQATNQPPPLGTLSAPAGGAQDLPDLFTEPASALPQAEGGGEPRAEASEFRTPARKRLALLALGGVGLIVLGGLAYVLFMRRAPAPVAAPQRVALAVPVPAPPPKPPPETAPASPTPEPPQTTAAEPDLGKLMARPKTGPNRHEAGESTSPGDQDSAEETSNASAGKKNRIASLEPEGGVKLKRERLRLRRIGSKDKRLLDLVGKTTDSAPAELAERLQLDTTAQALDEEQIARTFADNHKAFDACFSRALRQDPSLRIDGRKIVASFIIRPDGVVSGSSIDDRQIDQSSLGHCLKAVCGRLVFPAFEGNPIQVDAPLVLNRIE